MRLFPLRLILRLGALHRYYPTPILSNVNREPVFAEIGNTVMNFLADFRNFSYTIDIIKGLNIHMEERKTSVFIPKNRYDQIMKVINNSSDQWVDQNFIKIFKILKHFNFVVYSHLVLTSANKPTVILFAFKTLILGHQNHFRTQLKRSTFRVRIEFELARVFSFSMVLWRLRVDWRRSAAS